MQKYICKSPKCKLICAWRYNTHTHDVESGFIKWHVCSKSKTKACCVKVK